MAQYMEDTHPQGEVGDDDGQNTKPRVPLVVLKAHTARI